MFTHYSLACRKQNIYAKKQRTFQTDTDLFFTVVFVFPVRDIFQFHDYDDGDHKDAQVARGRVA